MESTAREIPRYTAEEYFKLIESREERTELLGGEIVAMASPNEQHQDIVLGIGSEIRTYIKSQNGSCKAMIAPFDVVLDEYNVVQPDVLVVCDPTKMDGKRCNGAPDWVVEVLSANRDNDLFTKLCLYKNAGVREYWIVDPKNGKILVYYFEKNDVPDIYTFDTPVPVEIYQRVLCIRIADLL